MERSRSVRRDHQPLGIPRQTSHNSPRHARHPPISTRRSVPAATARAGRIRAPHRARSGRAGSCRIVRSRARPAEARLHRAIADARDRGRAGAVGPRSPPAAKGGRGSPHQEASAATQGRERAVTFQAGAPDGVARPRRRAYPTVSRDRGGRWLAHGTRWRAGDEPTSCVMVLRLFVRLLAGGRGVTCPFVPAVGTAGAAASPWVLLLPHRTEDNGQI